MASEENPAERVLAHPPTLARLGKLASYHHERMDGSGYHRGVASDALSMQARILAAADVFVALTEERAYRPARTAETALEELRKEARSGRIGRRGDRRAQPNLDSLSR